MVEWKRKLEILSWSSVVQTLEIFALNSHDNHDPHSDISELNHCVKSGQIRSFFWSVFSRIRTEYGEILSVFTQNAGKDGPVKTSYLDTFHADLRPATILRKILAQVFSCEFCEIFKNTFFHRAPLVAASDII